MFTLFRHPYPIEEPLASKLLKATLIAGFIVVFLLLLQPFELNEWQTTNKGLKIIGFGGIVLVVRLMDYLVLPLLFPQAFSDQRWTVQKEIVRISLIVITIAFSSCFYLAWLITHSLAVYGWLRLIIIICFISLFPTTILVLLNYITQLKRYSRSAHDLSMMAVLGAKVPTLSSEVNSNSTSLLDKAITLLADNGRDKLVILAQDLLFIGSTDNYCTVCYLKNGQPTTLLIRSSLARLERQIAQPDVVRCHRSYVANLHHVKRITGNAQGYKLHLQYSPFQIPVARQYNETLVAQLKRS